MSPKVAVRTTWVCTLACHWMSMPVCHVINSPTCCSKPGLYSIFTEFHLKQNVVKSKYDYLDEILMSLWLWWEKQPIVRGVHATPVPVQDGRRTHWHGVLFRKSCACFPSSPWVNLRQAQLTPRFWETVKSSSGASPSFPLILLTPCSHSFSWCLQIRGTLRPSLTVLFNNLMSLCTFCSALCSSPISCMQDC